ncbi:YidC/Oxa1 family membrane protein insertase [Clavibacter sp. Sh2141]|uniref:YidC/Oxa1 family membrane protein insertase n=1 Tax=Clavibacter sp. Sh2141 TaxID=3395374 RepID=UPI0039BC7929
MDPTSIAPVRAVLDGLSQLVVGLADLIHPLAGSSATGVAVILLTLAVRALLVPVGVAQVRAEIQRRRLAPALAELRRRHAGAPERLSRATQELYAREGASPLAGCLPTLAQAPVLAAVYALFAQARIGGEANALLAAPFAGMPLGASALSAAGLGLVPVVVSVAVLALLAVVVEARRRADLRFQGPSAVADPALPGMAVTMRVLPFVTVVFAAVAPLAAALHLLSSAAWTLLERAALRRILGRARAAGTAPA